MGCCLIIHHPASRESMIAITIITLIILTTFLTNNIITTTSYSFQPFLKLTKNMQALRQRTITRPIYQLRATMSIAIQPNEPLEQSKIPQQPFTEEVTPKRLANLHFEHYVNTRYWKQSDEFWKRMLQRSRNTLPSYIRGDPESIYEIFLDFNATDYKMFQINEKGGSCLPLPADQGDYRGYTNGFGLSNLRLINRSYFRGQKLLKDPRYNQLKAFALDIGYYGPAYSGMQSQGKSIDPKTNKPYVTVESDLKVFFKQAMTSAGRTDSGVHALSQVIHYLTSEVNITSEEVLQRFRDGLKTLPEERLFAYDCQQVPKRFHPRSSALWRRYIFNFPLTRNPNPDDNHHSRSTDSSMNTHNHTNYVDFLKLDKILSQLQCKTLPFFTFSSNLDPRGQGLGDKCTIYIAKVQLIDLQTEKVIDPRSIHADGILSDNTSQPLAISIELVASRFVRKMIRILLGTALRECWFTAPNDQTNDMIKPPSDKPFNENVLIDLCHAENRGLTAYPLPSTGLAMAGVGYDPYDLSFCKFMPKNHCSFLNEQNERDFKKFNETNEYCISIKNSTFASNVTDYRQGKYIKLHRERSNYYRRLNETDYRNNSTSNGDRNSSKRNDSTDNRRRE